ncbi:protein peste-like [Zerene cesonia]|uniref:protein peste-like n=1 Tax=Zerene cesonia TaxID=33412 RepID=UPI0018E59B0A|nr:protein peste-like [Zerene cesonia]XP_038214514.1 protein peste-like [Zerene cesonia]
MRGRAPHLRRAGCALAALCAAAALAAALSWNSIFESVFSSQIALKPDSRAFRDWVAPTLPLLFDVYLFNWTNPEKFPEEIPNLEELGPYRFREHRRHVNVTWHPNNGSISYRTQRTWFFDESSNGTLEDNITIINVIAASAAYQSRDASFLRQKGLSMALTMFGHGISISRLAGELLFEGYEDPLIDIAKNLPESTRGGAPPIDRFGLFYGRNNSMDTDGDMLVTTGEEDGVLPGQIITWNHLDHLPYYEGKCSVMAGSAGEFMPHNLTEDTLLEIFMGDLCRTVYFNYTETNNLQGLTYHKYSLTESSFDYSPSSPENSCFCNGECGWSGVMNVSACRYGAPAFLSLPHFLHGDPELRTKVNGLNPDPKKHSFYFGVEPRLGVPVDVAARFQFNVYLEPTPNIALFEDAPRMMFPVFWVQQKVTIDDKVISELRMVRSVADWGATICACVALTFAGIITLASCCKKSQFKKPKDIIVTLEKPKDEAEMKLNPMQ